MSSREPSPPVFRASRGARGAGVVAIAFGMVISLSGIASGHIAAAITMSVFGLEFVLVGVLTLRAKVSVMAGALTVRNWRTTLISSEEMTALRPGSVGGLGRGMTLIAFQQAGRPVKLLALRGPTNSLETRADEIRSALSASRNQ